MSDTAAALAAAAFKLLQSGRGEEALQLVSTATTGATCCLPEHATHASLLLKLGRAGEAQAVIAKAEGFASGHGEAFDGLAYLIASLGEYERANALYLRATEASPTEPRFLYNLACSERRLGRLEDAERVCNRVVALDATQYPTYLLRSELRVQAEASNHIQELETALGKSQGDYRAAVFLGYALGKELDDVGRYDEAFRAFAAAAATRRSRLQYDVATDESKFRRIMQVYSRAQVINPAPSQMASGAAPRCTQHLFVIGLPRSGTTLLERILTGLPGVHSNGETDNFSRALMAAARGSGDVFERAAAADPAAIASHYNRLAGSPPGAGHLIEKLPLNYLYVGAIRRALPEARILLLKRSALDSCFAMYRTLFASGYPFSYDLVELGRYYAAYTELIAHWRDLFGASVFEVVYEDLVREPGRVGAAIARHCELTWDESATEIQNNKSVSLTASASQVRRPIYGSSSGRWRRYGEHLGPLIATLESRGISIG